MSVTDVEFTGGGVEIAGDVQPAFTPGDLNRGALSDVVWEWDLDNDGDYDEAEEDITAYVVEAESLSGRDFPSALTGKAGPGQLQITARNDDNRFSQWAAGPLTTAPFSLQSGRRIRARTAEADVDDPVLLARDRFNRPAGPLGNTETGQTWVVTAGTWSTTGGGAATSEGFQTIAVIDVGETDHYAQVSLRQLVPVEPGITSRNVGIDIRRTDGGNFTRVYIDTDPDIGVVIQDVDGGVFTILATFPIVAWEGMTLGAGVEGQTVTAYVAGVPVATAELTGTIDGTEVALAANWPNLSGRAPEWDDFYVWDHVTREVEGILWTGTVETIEPNAELGPNNTVTITAEGVLRRAAGVEIAAPRVPTGGAPTGTLVGDVMARARLLDPPAPLDAGDITTGPIGIGDGRALELARQFEETERGFLFETNEGPPGYAAGSARAAATSAAWFTDDRNAGQYGYHEIAPLAEHGQIINQVVAGVAADRPNGITVTQDAGSGHVDVTLPTVNAGDLLKIAIASTVDDGHDWNVPLWWTQHREAKAALGGRVYSHFCDGTESGTTVRFYSNTGGSPGLWVANIYRIEDWHEASQGVEMGDPVRGQTPGPLVHGWGRDPTLFIITQFGIGSSAGGEYDPAFNPPDGYGGSDGVIISSGPGFEAFDAGVISSHKIDCTETEDPTTYPGLAGYTITETVVFAVRGYNGPHTKATLDDPQTTGGDGRFVTVDDEASQEAHRAVRSHPSPAVLFADEAAAQGYGEAIVAGFADDRPIVTLSFFAHKSAGLRQQAIRRRVGDKITLTANQTTGLGIDADEFFIESIGHQWAEGGTWWQVTWELSPA
jgi:hypothetical protein